MASYKDRQQLKGITTETRRMVQAHGAKAPMRLKPAFEFIEANLFEKQLNYEALIRACPSKIFKFAERFQEVTGLTPMRYVWDLRLFAASRLLQETDFKIWTIGQEVGFGVAESFARSFKKWCGETPREFRKKVVANGESRPRDGWAALDSVELRKARLGRLNPEAFRTLLREQLASYPLEIWQDVVEEALAKSQPTRGEAAAGAPSPTSSCTAAGKPVPVEVWEAVEKTPASEAPLRRKIVLPAIIAYLKEMSRREGQENRRRGVLIARDAVEIAEILDTTVGQGGRSNLQASTWAWFGNTLRMILDFTGAETALNTAAARLPKSADPAVKADSLFYRAALRWYQQKYQAAEGVLKRALLLARGIKDHNRIAQYLNLKALIEVYSGAPRKGVSTIEEALYYAQAPPKYLEFALNSTLAFCYLELEEFGNAGVVLPYLKKTAEEVNNRYLKLLFLWAEGRVALGSGQIELASQSFQEAWHGFLAGHFIEHAAAVALDLAYTSSLKGSKREIIDYALQALPLFQAFRRNEEASVALKLLKNGIAEASIPCELLDQVRNAARALLRDPAAHLDAQQSSTNSLCC